MGIISDLRFWGEKKKWPKGLEPVGELCRRADEAVSGLADEVLQLRGEVERLGASVAFTLTDPARMLSKDDAAAVCPNIDLCFEYGNRGRCGPCAVKASAALGIEIDDTHSHLPEVCRLRRSLREAEQREKDARAKALEDAAKVADEAAAMRERLYEENGASINASKAAQSLIIAANIRALKV